MLLVFLGALVLSGAASACSCFPPELRLKTAQDALQSARVAVFGKVVDVDAGGTARVLVLESFKGPVPGTVIEMQADTGKCGAPSSAVGEEALLLSFDEGLTACHKHPPGHYLLESFREITGKAKK